MTTSNHSADSNERIFNLAYGISKEIIANESPKRDFQTLKDEVLHDITYNAHGMVGDVMISLLDTDDMFFISIDPLDYNNATDDYESLRDNMVTNYQSKTLEVFNKVEDARHTNDSKKDYIAKITRCIVGDSIELAAFLDLGDTSTISHQLDAVLTSTDFADKDTSSRAKRLAAVQSALSESFWTTYSDDIIAKCAVGSDEVLLSFAKKYKLYNMNITGAKNQLFSETCES